MKWLLVLCIAVMSVLAATSTAAASTLECNGTLFDGTVGNVVVPENSACTLVGVTVTGNVDVRKGAYFEANDTEIQGNVKGNGGLTIFTHDGSTIGGNVQANKTTQVFLFDGSVAGNVQAKSIPEPALSGPAKVQICGMAVGKSVQIQKAGRDILVGDSANGCGSNTIAGDVKIMDNFTDVELVVRDNTIGGKLTVSKNTGPSDKFVVNNAGGQKLQCDHNDAPFVGSPNSGFVSVKPGSQCTL